MGDCNGTLKRDGIDSTGKVLSGSVVESGSQLKNRTEFENAGKAPCVVLCPDKDSCEVLIPAADYEQSLTKVDQYGSKGFVQLEGATFSLDICLFEDFTKGPEVEEQSEENDFIYDWVFSKDLETGQYFYGRVGQELAPADDYWPVGTPSDRISMCFESTGRPVFAVGYQGQITVKREVAGSISTFGPFAGSSPQMFYNGELLDWQLDSDDRDAVCYYIKEGETELYARFQRDNFGIEYTIVTGLPTTFRLLFMAQAEVQRMSMKLFPSKGIQGPLRSRGLEIISGNYPPNVSMFEEASFSGGFVGGTYFLVVIDGGTVDEEASFAGRFGSIIYTDGVVALNPFDEEASFAGGFVSGLYRIVVVNAGTVDEEASFAGAFIEGAYILVVVDGGTHDEEAHFAGGFVEGEYAGPVYISSSSPLPGIDEGEEYDFQFEALTGTPPYTWTVISGDLPDGLTLETDGQLHGTPTESGAFTFTVQVEDDDEGTDSKEFSLTVVGEEFVPTDIADCELWLDASDETTLYDATSGGSLVAPDGAVARWEDKSGHARHATQATSGDRPVRKAAIQNGRDVLRWDGSSDHLFVPDFSLSTRTVYIVLRSDDDTGNRTWLRKGFNAAGSLEYFLRSEPSGVWRSALITGAGDVIASATESHTATVWGLYSQSYDATTHSMSLNGAAPTDVAATGTVRDGSFRLRIGAGYVDNSDTSAPTEVFLGDIAEILVYTRALTPTERRTVEEYLQSKWGTPALPPP